MNLSIISLSLPLISNSVGFSFCLPLSSFERSRISFTSRASLSVSLIMISRCSLRFLGLSPERSRIISAYALSMVSGVLRSCETFAIRSRCILSTFESSCSAYVSVSASFCDSRYPRPSNFVSKSPLARFSAAFVILSIGLAILSERYSESRKANNISIMVIIMS